MTNTEFYAALRAAPEASCNVRLDAVWQYALMLKACTDDAAVVALTQANPKLAAAYAAQEAVIEALDAPNHLHAVIAAAPDDATALAMLEAAPHAVRAEYANDLALLEYTQSDICARYRELVLGESQ